VARRIARASRRGRRQGAYGCRWGWGGGLVSNKAECKGLGVHNTSWPKLYKHSTVQLTRCAYLERAVWLGAQRIQHTRIYFFDLPHLAQPRKHVTLLETAQAAVRDGFRLPPHERYICMDQKFTIYTLVHPVCCGCNTLYLIYISRDLP
jgi:hypothetical protein